MKLRLIRFPSRFALVIGMVLTQLGSHPGRAADVLTQHYNNARTGATLDETVLKTSNVSSAKFGKLWTLYADGQVVAQPLYVAGLTIDTTANPNTPAVKGTFNAIILATMHNTRLRLRRRQGESRTRRPNRPAVGNMAWSSAARRQRHRHVEH